MDGLGNSPSAPVKRTVCPPGCEAETVPVHFLIEIASDVLLAGSLADQGCSDQRSAMLRGCAQDGCPTLPSRSRRPIMATGTRSAPKRTDWSLS